MMPQPQHRHFERIVPQQPVAQPVDPPRRGMFWLSFNNRRKQLPGYVACECEGTRYSSGFVHLDTHAFPIREFTTLTEMQDVLGAYGDVEITWFTEGAAS
jgi:hypothetical protein